MHQLKLLFSWNMPSMLSCSASMFSLGGSRVAMEVSVEHRLWLQDNTKLVTYRVVNGSEITLQVIFTIGIIGKKNISS